MADSNPTTNQGGAIGHVKLITGNVTAIDSGGVERILQPGDAVFADDVIVTSSQAGLVIELRDGSSLSMGANSETILDDEVYNPGAAEDITDRSSSIDAIQQAILAGADPTQLLDATAAGAGEAIGDGNQGQVSVERLGAETTPESGFETTGLNQNVQGQQTDEGAVLSVTSNSATTLTPINSAPTIAVTALDFTEDAGALVGDTAATYVISDAEGDSATVSFTAGSNLNGHYALAGGQVVLTQAGVNQINAGNALDIIELTVTQDNDPSLFGTGSDTPVVTSVNDTPDAVDDAASGSEGGSISVLSGGATSVLVNDSDADGNPLTVSSFTQPANGTVTVNPDGSFSYTHDGGESTSDSFTYTVSDGQGGSDTATVNLTISGVNDVPQVGTSTATVSEEGLAGGIGDDTGSPDTTNDFSVSGTIAINDIDGDVITATLSAPASSLSSNNTPLTWSGDGTTGNPLVGHAGGQLIVTVDITNVTASEISYTVTLSGPLDHPVAGVEDVFSFDLGVHVSDGLSTTDSTLTVNVEDDQPVSGTLLQSLEVPEANTNIMLILDYSGSMSGDNLTNMKSALIDMLNAYEEAGVVAVQLVSFASSAATIGDGGWISAQDAITYISSLTDSDMGGSTNYDAALTEAQNAFAQSAGKLTGSSVKNVAYFLSDGQPTAGDGTIGIDSTEAGEWETYLVGNAIDSYAVGFGGAALTELEPIAYNGIADVERPALDAAISDLSTTLLETISYETPEANLFGSVAGDGFGADRAGHVADVTIGGVVYTYDVASDQVTGAGGNVVTSGSRLSVVTDHGGTITLDMLTGKYSYSVKGTVRQPYTEDVGYTLQDADGDISKGTALLEISPQGFSGPTALDEVQMASPTHASGLLSEYYAYIQGSDGANLTTVSQVRSFVLGRSADATFLGETVFYNYGNGDLAGDNNTSDSLTNLEAFLGTDAASLSVDDPALGSDAILHMQGYIALDAGTYNFSVHSDDGFAIYIDGQAVAVVDRIQSPATSVHPEFTINLSGDHHIEIFYWDQGGAYVFEPQLRVSGADYQQLSTFGLKHVSDNVISGSVMDNIDFGPDGAGQIDSIAFNGVTYNAADYAGSGDTVIIGTQSGGQLTFDFSTGLYTFDNTNGAPTPSEIFSVTASDIDGDAVIFELRLGSEGIYVATETDDFNTDNHGWQTASIGNPTNLTEASTSSSQLLVERDHLVQKQYQLTANQTTSVTLDLDTLGDWENADTITISVNGAPAWSVSNDFAGPVSFVAQADGDGNLLLEVAIDTSHNSEQLAVDNVTLRYVQVVDNTLYGSDTQAEQFVMDDDEATIVVDYDQYNDAFVLNDTGPATTGADDIIDGADGEELLFGGKGSDTLDGQAGNDVLVGGAGNDILVGGDGDDLFLWNAGDEGFSTPVVDTIKDFGLGGDALHLGDLLVGEHDGNGIDANNLDQYLHFSYDQATGNTTINVSTTGDVANSSNQQIVMEGVNLTSLGGSDADIIQSLLANAQLITD